MEIATRDFGTVEIDESSIITFEEGIIGFENYHGFVLLDSSDETSPFRCLQSTEDNSLAFMLLDPYTVRPDYEVEINEDTAALLSVDGNEDIAIFAIVVVPENYKMMSINLKAPIIINAREHIGAQYIIDKSEYGVRHFLTDEIERTKNLWPRADQTAV